MSATWITITDWTGSSIYFGTGWIQALTKYGEAKSRRPERADTIREANLPALKLCLQRIPERTEFARWRERLTAEIAAGEQTQ